MEGNKLINKFGLDGDTMGFRWVSDDKWNFKTTDDYFYIDQSLYYIDRWQITTPSLHKEKSWFSYILLSIKSKGLVIISVRKFATYSSWVFSFKSLNSQFFYIIKQIDNYLQAHMVFDCKIHSLSYHSSITSAKRWLGGGGQMLMFDDKVVGFGQMLNPGRWRDHAGLYETSILGGSKKKFKKQKQICDFFLSLNLHSGQK